MEIGRSHALFVDNSVTILCVTWDGELIAVGAGQEKGLVKIA